MKLWKILGAGIGAVWLTGTVVTMSTPWQCRSFQSRGRRSASAAIVPMVLQRFGGQHARHPN